MAKTKQERVTCKPCRQTSPKLPVAQAKQGRADHDRSMHNGQRTAR